MIQPPKLASVCITTITTPNRTDACGTINRHTAASHASPLHPSACDGGVMCCETP